MDTKNGSMKLPLIAPKPFKEFAPDEFQEHVKKMYEVRQKGSKPASPAEGISLSKTKKGKVSIRHSAKTRPIKYVTRKEVEALAKHYGFSQAEVWNAFKEKSFLIVENSKDAEEIKKTQGEIPW